MDTHCAQDWKKNGAGRQAEQQAELVDTLTRQIGWQAGCKKWTMRPMELCRPKVNEWKGAHEKK